MRGGRSDWSSQRDLRGWSKWAFSADCVLRFCGRIVCDGGHGGRELGTRPAVERTPFEAHGAVEGKGILRLRRDFASLRHGSAQDDIAGKGVRRLHKPGVLE